MFHSTVLSSPLSLHPSQHTNLKPYNNNNNNKPSKKHNIILKPLKNTTKIDTTVSWTSSISHHCKNGSLQQAISNFTKMRLAGIDPNHVTFISLLSACDDTLGRALHAYVCKLSRLDKNNVKVGTALVGFYSKQRKMELAQLCFDGILYKNQVSWNSMIDGYMRNGFVEEGVRVFDEMKNRDVVSWTVMINGFLKENEFEQALDWFIRMQLSGVKPDYVTIVSVLSACANLGALGLGLWVHKFVMDGKLEENVRISNSLIDMYFRCGCIEFASWVFEKMRFRTVVSWNSMIVGFSMNGYAKEALGFFKMMQNEGFVPDEVSFTGALTACSHSGLVDEGLKLFDQMRKIYRIFQRIEHYGCIVDLYSRAGRLEDALNVIENMPMKPNVVILGSLLASCVSRGDVNLAERLMKYLYKLDPRTDSNYVLLSNIYAAVGSWDGANGVRKKMKDMGIKKRPGISSIEVNCDVREFVAGDKSHADTGGIYGMLELLHTEMGLDGSFPVSYVGELHD